MRRRPLFTLGAWVRAARREWDGAAAYERYVQCCRAQGRPALDRGRYFAQRLEERYARTSRCC
jgi:hypothetical protein